MNHFPKIKFCGLAEKEQVAFAVKNNIYWAGFIYVKGSSRFITYENSKNIISSFKDKINFVGVFVNADNDHIELGINAGIDYIQLHGEESPKRCEEIKNIYKKPIIKAIPIEDESDLKNIENYNNVCDYFLFDKKNTNKKGYNGGTGKTFDWNIIYKNKEWLSKFKPWILSGGLDIYNINQAINLTETKAIDVSSGIEYSSGIKSMELMDLFVKKINNYDYEVQK
jgi:phosphoribosylanthranilate isomerase